MKIFQKIRKSEKTLNERQDKHFSADKVNSGSFNAVVRIMRQEIQKLQFDMSILKRDMRRIEAKQYKQPAATLNKEEQIAMLRTIVPPPGDGAKEKVYQVGEETL